MYRIIPILFLVSTLLGGSPLYAEPAGIVDSSTLRAAGRFQEGVDLWQAGQTNEAIDAWENATRLDPHLAEAHYNLGIARRDQGILNKRRNCLLQYDPLECLTSVDKVSHAPSENLERALRSLKETTRLNPRHPKAFHLKGVIEGQLGRYRQAEASFSKHLAQHPHDSKSHFLLCSALRARQQLKRAAVACNNAVREQPRYPEAYHLLGMIYLELEHSDYALIAFKEVIKVQPRAQSAWFNVGIAETNRGQTFEAIDAYKRALDLGPDHGAIHLNLGALYDELEKGSQAIHFTRQAKQLFADRQEWRQVSRAERNLQHYMKKYWGLPSQKTLFQ